MARRAPKSGRRPPVINAIFGEHGAQSITDCRGVQWFVLVDVLDIVGINRRTGPDTFGNFPDEFFWKTHVRRERRSIPLYVVRKEAILQILLRSKRPQAWEFAWWFYRQIAPELTEQVFRVKY